MSNGFTENSKPNSGPWEAPIFPCASESPHEAHSLILLTNLGGNMMLPNMPTE